VSGISIWRMYLCRILSLKGKRVDGKECDHQREIDDVVGRRKGEDDVGFLFAMQCCECINSKALQSRLTRKAVNLLPSRDGQRERVNLSNAIETTSHRVFPKYWSHYS
jgi:hypothetical protein